ncbi:MAG: CoA-binding protein [Clostridia bacterium]|jgi:predicted CoA-binding protein|nr:CoA-binding protein [Clostridia bacterium]
MDLKNVMEKKNFVVVGDTLNPEKFAYKIKSGLTEHGYNVHAVGKELESINDVQEKIDIIDLCINPAKGLKLMKECKKDFDCIVIQPGAESNELENYLKENNLPYINNCVLVGLDLYGKKS